MTSLSERKVIAAVAGEAMRRKGLFWDEPVLKGWRNVAWNLAGLRCRKRWCLGRTRSLRMGRHSCRKSSLRQRELCFGVLQVFFDYNSHHPGPSTLLGWGRVQQYVLGHSFLPFQGGSLLKEHYLSCTQPTISGLGFLFCFRKGDSLGSCFPPPNCVSSC